MKRGKVKSNTSHRQPIQVDVYTSHRIPIQVEVYSKSMSLIQNINGRLIPTAEVTSLREQTTKARITKIYLFFKKTNFFARYFGLQYKPSLQTEISGKKICFFKKQIYFSYSSFCCLFSQARHLRRWDQSAVNILYLR